MARVRSVPQGRGKIVPYCNLPYGPRTKPLRGIYYSNDDDDDDCDCDDGGNGGNDDVDTYIHTHIVTVHVHKLHYFTFKFTE